jgi:hypothetical protein
MHLVVTVKAIPESQDELQDHFKTQLDQVREHFTLLVEQNVIWDRDKIDVRYLVDTTVMQPKLEPVTM